MFLLTRRQAHAALAGTGAALAYLAAAELGSRKTVRVGGLMVLSSMAMAGLMASKSSAKSRSTEARLNDHIAATAPAVNLVANGGTIGGSLTVSGNHHSTGSITADGNLVANSNLNATGLASLNGGVETNGATVHTSGGNATVAGLFATTVNSTGLASLSGGVDTGGGFLHTSGGNATVAALSATSVSSTGAATLGSAIMNGTLNVNGNNVNGIGGLNASGNIPLNTGLIMGGNINMNGFKANNAGTPNPYT